LQFLKTLDPDWIRIRIGIQPKILIPKSITPDPKHWLRPVFKCLGQCCGSGSGTTRKI